MWIRSVVSNRVPSSTPSLSSFFFNQRKSSQGQPDLQIALNHLLPLAVVASVSLENRFKGFYSNLVTVPKPSGVYLSYAGLKILNVLLCSKVLHGICKVGYCLIEKRGIIGISRHPKCLYSHLPTSPDFLCLAQETHNFRLAHCHLAYPLQSIHKGTCTFQPRIFR